MLHTEDGPRRDAGHTPHEPVVAALRRATRDRHRDIEAQLQLDGRFTRRRYAAVVHGFAEFLAAWEPRLDAALPVRLRPWFAGRARGALARRDVAALVIDDPLPTSAPKPAAALAHLRLPSVAAAFGSLYVMEGSSLGGQLIARRAATQLGLAPDRGTAYFQGHGRETGARWREFCALLDREVGTGEPARAAACRAATQTFDALAATFAPICHALDRDGAGS